MISINYQIIQFFHLYKIVTTVLLVLKLEVVEAKVDVAARRGLDYPVAVLLVVVVHIPELGVGEQLGWGDRGREMATTHSHMLSHESLINSQSSQSHCHSNGIIVVTVTLYNYQNY